MTMIFLRNKVAAAIGDAYAIGGASPELVAAFTTQSDGTTAGEYYRKASSETTFDGLFTHSVSGLRTMTDSTGTLVWAPHNYVKTQIDGAFWRESNLTHASSAQSLPGLTETMVLLTEDDTVAGSLHRSFLNNTESSIVKAGVKYRFGGFFKTNGRHVVLCENNTSDGFGTAEIKVNLSTGALISETDTDDYGISLVSDGVYYCWIEKEAVNNDTRVRIALCDETGDTTYDGDGVSGLYVGGLHIYRADLGGMADNPDMPAGLEKYVPTTSAAKYLPRRQAYRYNSGWELAGMQMEAAAATNALTYSRGFTTGWASSGTPTVTLDETGIDGAANTAATITCDDSGAYEYIYATAVCPDDSNPSAAGIFVKYDASFSGAYPVLGLYFLGGTTVTTRIIFNPSDGSYVSVNAPTSVRVVRHSADWWYVELVATNNGTGNTSCRIYVWPGASVDGTTLSSSGTGSFVVDQAQMEIGKNITSSPIITNGSTVTRAAETLTIAGADTPANTTAMSISMKGLMTYADNGAAAQETFLRWYADANNYISLDLDTDSTATGEVNANQSTAGTLDTVVAGAEYSPGVNVAFNIASRHTSGAVNVAKDGTAATADTTPTALADLSSTALQLGYDFNGYISEFRMWGTDIGDSGIAEVTS